ncbi:3-oxoadipate enol-lactonase [Litoreibacter albidus]|uniref:3-oxoadipate enol-lactonase n=1 Tax=Litoreibacter albidus TaxID=670155 RepID=UPI0037367496
MQVAPINDIFVHWREDGDPTGMPVLFANSLGTDLRLWDDVLPLLPVGYRYIRYDKRGHGLTTATPAPYGMTGLVSDAASLLDHLGVKKTVIIGLSIGGMIAQGLAATRPDLVSALVLSNTAARMGTPQMWQERIDNITTHGIDACADDIMARWFAPAFGQSVAANPWRHMLTRTPVEGYLGCCHAIAQTDFTQSTAHLNLKLLAISGAQDGACPPESVAATAGLVPNSRAIEMPDVGHLPCVEAPEAYSAILTPFLKEVKNAVEI